MPYGKAMTARSRKISATQKPRSAHRRKAVYGFAGILVLGAACVSIRGYLWTGLGAARPPRASADNRFLLPPITPSRFRNGSATVGYVGSDACARCHRDEHDSYRRTTHSRSLGEVDVAREPPDAVYRHDLSGRTYRIYRAAEALRLSEFIDDSDGREVVLTDHAAHFALGSGNHQRMYLIKVDDFMVEAPVTWYPRRKLWGMSAGYEKDPLQPGFRRAVSSGCLYCHAGRVEPVGDAGERVRVLEMAIGCERCHGPGELHVRERTADLPAREGFDDSIVDPRRLPREAQEDICAQCHLSTAANVAVRGRRREDYRPGMRMADFVVNYRIDRPDTGVTVSGQVEQLRMSRCYVESRTLTCITCHDPHAPPEQDQKVEHYRNQCLSCHQAEPCTLPVKARVEKEPNDYCVNCHMPRSPTDIPHLSFADHRVRIHAPKADDKLVASDELVAAIDVSHLPEHERLRLLGLANDEFAGKLGGGLTDETRHDPFYQELSWVFHDRARRNLEEVRSRGLHDPEIEAFFSTLHWRKNPALCIEYSEAALRSQPLSRDARKVVLYNLGTSHFDRGEFDQALPHLEELAMSERSEISLMLLAICHQKKGHLPESVRLIEKAISLSPDRADLHDYLASIYRTMGKAREAGQHVQQAALLRQQVPQPR
jgi:hypothetical protein